jgi:hypothetical protein
MAFSTEKEASDYAQKKQKGEVVDPYRDTSWWWGEVPFSGNDNIEEKS